LRRKRHRLNRIVSGKSFDEKAGMPDLFAAHQQLATAAAETNGNDIIAVGVTRSTKKEPSQKLAEVNRLSLEIAPMRSLTHLIDTHSAHCEHSNDAANFYHRYRGRREHMFFPATSFMFFTKKNTTKTLYIEQKR
jgi:hypothetical protein